ncbi:MAG TPA: FAD-dependent oxidoreductase [Chloroflexia bacterium]|nr:FAD-dependent oxidoreductase [Chloroflexia bacterium]
MQDVTVYGTTWCSDCKRAKKFLGEQRVAYNWVDVEADGEGLAFIETAQNGGHSVPTIAFGDGTVLVEPENAELARLLGLPTKAQRGFYDVVIIGGGPAGLMAGIYLAREGVDCLIVERAGLGGQAGVTERLDNFPGWPDGILGAELSDRLSLQARRFGVEMLSAQAVESIETHDGYRDVHTTDGAEYGAQAILVATGSTYARLNVPGEEDFIGSGIHFCATCDGPFYKGKPVMVVGGGNSAGEESIFLARFASEVTILVRGPKMSASQIVQQKLSEDPKIKIRYNTTVDSFLGKNKLETTRVRNSESGETEDLTPAGVFVFVGLKPNAGFLPREIKRDGNGFVVTGLDLQTNMPGVFAAGDVRAGSTKQAASATGEGATAALMIREFLKHQ